MYNSDGTTRVVLAPGGPAAAAIAAATTQGHAVVELAPLLSPTCCHDNVIGLLGVVLGPQRQPQMLVLELASVRDPQLVAQCSQPPMTSHESPWRVLCT